MAFTTGDDHGDVPGAVASTGHGGSRWCLECGGEWVEEVDLCPDCELPLASANPFAELPPPSDDDAHVEYELDAWGAESRVMLDQLLVAASIPHVWHGWGLVVPERHELQVDTLVEQVEVTMLPTLDPGAEKAAFTLEDWDDDRYETLMARLDEEQVPYEWDVQHDLIVLAEHGDLVERLIDEVEFPDAIDEDAAIDDELAADDDDRVDIDPDEVLGGLFIGVDRLQRDPRDHRGVIATAEQGAIVLDARSPFGFPAAPWATIVDRTRLLVAMLASDRATDDEVQDAAIELRSALRPYV